MVSKFSDSVPVVRAADRPPVLIGVLFLAAGFGIASVGWGWIPAPLDSFQAPREIVVCAGLLFAVAGLLAAGNGRLPGWFSGLAAACLWTLFAVIPSWIAWGAGPRAFAGDGFWLLAILGLDFQSLGRTVFGLSALLLWACAIGVWGVWIKALPWAARLPAVAGLIAVVVWLVWARHLEPAWAPGESEEARLERYIALKHADPDFSAGSPSPFVEPRAEAWIKSSRARLAAARKAPPGVAVIDLARAAAAPELDGRIDEAEWRAARRFVSPTDRGARFAMVVHGSKLYIAGEAPADRTEQGFDQMRFWFHLGLAPSLRNERVFLSGRGGPSALRAVKPAGKTREVTEWAVLRDPRGASAVAGHRQFELEIDLAEAGLSPGAVFPFFLEIEGDPIRTPAGKFKSRVIEGRVGSAENPLWARVPG